MTCKPEILKRVPLIALLDDDELAVLAAQVNRRAEAKIQGLARKLNLLDKKIDNIASLLRRNRAR